MINNFLKSVIYVFLLLISTPGTDSFVLIRKNVILSPYYRTKITWFALPPTQDTINIVSELVAQKFDKKKEEIDPESDFLKEFGADKLDEVEFLISLEDEFDLNIPNNQFRSLRTVKDIAKYVDSKLQAEERQNL